MMSCMTFSLQMTVHLIPAPSLKCRRAWICSAKTLSLQLAQRRPSYQPAPTVPYIEPTVTVASEKLTVADKFTYLGNTILRIVTINKEVNYRTAYASAALADYKPVCGREEVSNCKPHSRCTGQSVCPPCCMPVRHGQSTVTKQNR